MSYKVIIQPAAKAQIESWGLARDTLIQVYSRLSNDLPADPDAHLRERVVPLDLYAYHFALGAPPVRLLFMFAVRRLDDQQELHVVGGRLTREDVSEN